MEVLVAVVAAAAAIVVAALNRKPQRVVTEVADEVAERDELIYALQLALRHCLEEHAS